MKTTKKIFAALLVVMMLVMMIPFSASAATIYSVTIQGKEGYSIDVYKIATVNIETGAYSDIIEDDAIKSLLGTKVDANGVASKTLLEKCEATTALGSTIAHITFDATATTTFKTPIAGIYYIKVTGTPAGTNVKKTGGSVVSIPYYSAADKDWVAPSSPLELKIEDGSVNVGKKIVEGTTEVTSTTANIGDTITFKLTASVTGSKSAPLDEYTIHDTMSKGLDTANVVSVYVDSTPLTVNTDYKVDATDLSDIKISLTKDYLDNAKKAEGDNGFYSASNVVVTLTAKLNSEAEIGATTANTNSDSLTYKYANESEPKTVTGETVKVYTFELNVLKVDANDDTKKLAGAGFTVYTNEACTEVALDNNGNEIGKEAKTDADGNVKFTGFKAGEYYIKETTAPAGYSLNSAVYTVVVKADGTITYGDGNNLSYLTVKDTPIVLPATGGMGTMMFTIIGASLIVCAGVLFFVVRRKNAAK